MGQVLHGSARTTAAVRRALQQRQASLKALAARQALTPKTVAKWRKRASVEDAKMGPKEPRSTVLTPGQEAACVALREQTLLPLDDCPCALQGRIPGLTRSSLPRCFQRHGISRLPELAGATPPKQAFRHYPIGYFHVDIAEVRTEEGKLDLFVASDRTAQYAYAELLPRAGKLAAARFLRNLVAAVPYAIRTILTDNGIQFTNRPQDRRAFTHICDRACHEHAIEHRLTKPSHPWTNGQVERMNRTLKDATVSRYHYSAHQQLREHLHNFLNAYNFAKRLKTLQGLTPYQYLINCWQQEPRHFRADLHHHTLGLNT